MSQLLRGFNSALSVVSDALALNQATLSGAIDIVVVETNALSDTLAGGGEADGSIGRGRADRLTEALDLEAAHKDTPTAVSASASSSDGPGADGESLVCTPFHVRFGKLQLLRSREKLVSIRVNDVQMPFAMKLGSDGGAYFVLPCSEPVEGQEEMMSSPLMSPQTSPEVVAANASSAGTAGGTAALAQLASRLPELDLASPGTAAAAQAFPLGGPPDRAFSPPASGDAVVAAVRASGESGAQAESIINANVARQSVAAAEAMASGVAASPAGSVASSPSRSAPLPLDTSAAPGSQLFQIGFGSSAPHVVSSTVTTTGPRALSPASALGLDAESAVAQSTKRGWMRSIFGSLTGGVFSGPETTRMRDKTRRDYEQLEREHQAANLLMWNELAQAAQHAQPDAIVHPASPPLIAEAKSASNASVVQSILGAAATADLPTPPLPAPAPAAIAPVDRAQSESASASSSGGIAISLVRTMSSTVPSVSRDREHSPMPPSSPTSPLDSAAMLADFHPLPPAAESVTRASSANSLTIVTAAPNVAVASPLQEASWPQALGPFPYTPSLSDPAADPDVALQLSLCGPFLTSDGVNNALQFKRFQVTYAAFCQQPTLHSHPHLAVLHPQSHTLYPARLALPMLIGQLAFAKPLTLTAQTAQQLNQAMDSGPSASLSPGSAPLSSSVSASASASLVSAVPSTSVLPPHHRQALSEGVPSAVTAAASAARPGASGGGWRSWFRGGKKPIDGLPPPSLKTGAAAGGSSEADMLSPNQSGPSTADSSRAQSPALGAISPSLTTVPSATAAAGAAAATSNLLSPPRASPRPDVFLHASGIWLKKVSDDRRVAPRAAVGLRSWPDVSLCCVLCARAVPFPDEASLRVSARQDEPQARPQSHRLQCQLVAARETIRRVLHLPPQSEHKTGRQRHRWNSHEGQYKQAMRS